MNKKNSKQAKMLNWHNFDLELKENRKHETLT